MNLREEVFFHNETLWILCIGQDFTKKPLSPLMDMVDWYNNQLLTKGLLSRQISYNYKSKTLLPTTGFLSLSRLLILGLGDEKTLTEIMAKEFVYEVDETLKGLGEKAPWIIFPPTTSPQFISGFNKNKSKSDRLTAAPVSMD